MANIAMENPPEKWRFRAGKIIYFYGPSIPWQIVSHNQRVILLISERFDPSVIINFSRSKPEKKTSFFGFHGISQQAMELPQ